MGVLTANSTSFDILAGAATTLVWTTQPTNNTLSEADLTPVIEIRDNAGNVVDVTDDATADITLSINSVGINFNTH